MKDLQMHAGEFLARSVKCQAHCKLACLAKSCLIRREVVRNSATGHVGMFCY